MLTNICIIVSKNRPKSKLFFNFNATFTIHNQLTIMKQQLALAVTVFFALLLVQCKEKSTIDLQSENTETNTVHISGLINNKTSTVHISGLIHNKEKYPKTKELQIEIPEMSGKNFKIVAPIDENGNFNFQFELNQAQDIHMKPYLEFLYVLPNDSLYVELDFNDLTNVKLSGGKSAEINSDFQNYFNQTYYRSVDYEIGTDCTNNCSVEEIIKLLNDKKALFYERRNAFLKTTQIHKDVLYLTESMIELDYYSTLINIMLLRNHYGKEIINPTTLMNEIEKNTTKYFSDGPYSYSHFEFVGRAYILLRGFISPSDKTLTYLLNEKFPNETIRNFVFARQASYALEIKDFDNFEKLHSQVNNEYFNSRLVMEYQMTLAKTNNLKAFSAAITGKSTDSNQNILSKKNVLAEMITQNLGKVHVIDIWATWCGACIAEFPHSKSLITHYENEDVVFSFLCAGGNEQQSHKVLQKHGLSNQPNYFCTNEEYFFLSTTFSPLSLPYGILINKKGVIVDHGSHVRPTLIQEKIDLLLKQDDLIK